LLAEKGFGIENIDTTLILQNPKLAPHILQMRKNISEILAIELNKISIKATTTDHLGFIGKGEGIAASAVILIAENIGN
jgi:2-C-methyl-D-erythritol 2,4-cyclodiphosphate synthase